MAGPFDDLIPAQAQQPQGAPAGSDANPIVLGPNDPGPGPGVAYVTPGGVQYSADGNSWKVVGQPGAGPPGGTPQAAAPAPQAAPAQQASAPAQPAAVDIANPFADLIPTQGAAPDFRQHGILGDLNTIGRTVARGVPILGQAADYADAATNATLAPYLEPLLDMIPGHQKSDDIGGGKTWQDRFDRAMAFQRGMNAQVDHDAPIASAAGQLIGGVGGVLASGGLLTPATGALTRLAPAAGIIPQMATGAVDGGLLGAGTGYLQGDGGALDPSRFHDAAQDAAFGAAAGGAAPAAFGAAKSLWGSTIGKALDALTGGVRVGAPEAAPNPLADALAAPGGGAAAPLSPQQQALADALAGHQVGGGSTAPDTVAGAASNLPSKSVSQDDLADALMAQARAPSVTVPRSAANGAFDRVYQALHRAGQTPDAALGQAQSLGPFGMLADTSVPMTDFARTVADAPGQGGQIARDSLDLRQSGVLEGGQYRTRPAALRIADTLGSTLGVSGRGWADDTAALLQSQKAAAGPAYAKAYGAAPADLSDLRDFAGSPMFRAAYDRARAISQKEFVTLPDGAEQIQPLPQNISSNGSFDWRTLDLMKQGMDDMVREGRVQGIGANEQNATKGFLSRFVAKLDSLNPDYAKARAAFAGPARAMDALDEGRAYMAEDAPAIGSAMSKLSPSEREFYRVGALQAERDRLGAVPDTLNAALRAGVNTPNRLAKLQQLFPDAESFGRYADMLKNENTMFATRARVLSGSQTSRNLTHAADADHNPLEAIAEIGEMAHNPVGGSMRLLGRLLTAGNGQRMTEDEANAAASILFNASPDAFPGFSEGLSEAARRAALAKALQGTAVPGASASAVGLADALQHSGDRK